MFYIDNTFHRNRVNYVAKEHTSIQSQMVGLNQPITSSQVFMDDSKLLVDFLQSSKDLFFKSQQNSLFHPTVHFVLGNEAADMDSIVSSIVVAYSLWKENLWNENNDSENNLYLPLLNLSKEQISMRKDTLLLLQMLNIPIDALLFSDDVIQLDSLHDAKKLRLTLVDHNVLKVSQQKFADVVEGIIDHHKDMGTKYPLLGDKKIIQTVGSNSTLIVEKLQKSNLLQNNPSLALLLLAPILLDTANLQSESKTTPQDRQAVKELREIIGNPPETFYQSLYDSRHDISDYTTSMLLELDYKEFCDNEFSYGISSMLSIAPLWSKQDVDIIKDVEKYVIEKKQKLLILHMSDDPKNGENRKIIVYSPNPAILAAFNEHVSTNQELNSEFKLISDQNEAMLHYKLPNNLARKKMQPMFQFPKSFACL